MDEVHKQITRVCLQKVSNFAMNRIEIPRASAYKIHIKKAFELLDHKYNKECNINRKKKKKKKKKNNKQDDLEEDIANQDAVYLLRKRTVYLDSFFEKHLSNMTKLEHHVWIQKDHSQFQYKQLLVNYRKAGDESYCSKGHYRNIFQNGVQFDLYIGRCGLNQELGFGVFSLECIYKGSAVFEYSGELLTERQAVERETKFSSRYMYDLEGLFEDSFPKDYVQSKDLPNVIDACFIGNASRFLNHSCDPNLMVKSDPAFLRETFETYGVCRVVFEAIRFINKGEELTVDYHPWLNKEDLVQWKCKKKCYCNAGDQVCRGWILR